MQDLHARSRYRWFAAVSAFALLVCCPGRVSAQSKFADRLPASTISYLEWHGSTVVLSDAAKNHFLQLTLDPKLAPVWAGLAQSIRAQQKSPGSGLEFPDVISLLSNELAWGLVELPAKASAPAPGKRPDSHVATFIVYDDTGKAELVQKLKAANLQGGTQPGVQVGPWTSYDFHGTQVESRTIGMDRTYRAQAGHYYLISDQKQVIEDLIGRFGGTEQPASSLAQRPEYQEARKYIDSDVAIEFFFRPPDFSRWIDATNPKAKQQAQMLAGLHLEKIHAGGGSVSFAGEATHMRGAILGDTSPGSFFDLLGESRSTFVTEPLASMGPSFSATRMNWAAGYDLLQAAVVGTLPPQQAANVTIAETMAQAFLGMPIGDALKLFSGEVGSATSYSDDGMSQQVYAVTIQKPDAVLRILRAVGGKMIVAEDSAGTTTYLDVAYPYHDPVSGTQRRKFYYVAVTPDMMLVAPRKAMLRQAASLLASPASAPAGVLANPVYQQLRSRLPGKLTAMSAADLTQIPWDKLAANFQAGAKTQNGTSPQAAIWLKSIPPDVVSRYLQMSVGGWWKDANGIYIESYLQ
jgi:hypothetical protein